MSKCIGAFGEVMMRMQVPGHALLSQADQLDYSFSGTGVNVLTSLTRFGHHTALVTTLPDNPLGDAAIANITKLGIAPTHILRYGKNLGMYFLESGFGVRPSRVTYTNRLESSFNTTDIQSYDFTQLAQQLDTVHFCGITLAMNDAIRKQMKTFAHQVKENRGTVVFDCNYRPSLWGPHGGYKKAKSHYEDMLKYANIVMMNEQDARYILGMHSEHINRRDQLTDLIPLVANKYQIKTIAGTHRTINQNNTHTLIGYLFQNDTFHFSDPVTFSVLDRIGAGDAFTSGIIHGLSAGFSNQDTVNFATTAAMIAHSYVGDSSPATVDEILTVASLDQVSDIQR